MRKSSLIKPIIFSVTATWMLPSGVDAQATQACTNGESNCDVASQQDTSEAQSKLQSFNSLMAEARKLARNDRDAQYLTGLNDGLRGQMKACPHDDYYPHCLVNAIEGQTFNLQNAVEEYRSNRKNDAAEQSESPSAINNPAESNGAPQSQASASEVSETTQAEDAASRSAANERAPEGTISPASGPERKQSGGIFAGILLGLAGLMLYFGVKTGRMSTLFDTIKNCGDGTNQTPAEFLLDEAALAKLTSEQQAIYQKTTQEAHSQARWGFAVWATCIFASLYLLIGSLIAGEGIWESISLIGIVGGLIGVVAYWKLGYEGRKSKKLRAGSAAVRCSSCGSPFAIKVANRVERLIAAVPRTSTSSSSGQISQSGGGSRRYVDVRTSTWTEEKYEVTTDYQCVICGDETRKVTMKTRNTNRHSGTERKYY